MPKVSQVRSLLIPTRREYIPVGSGVTSMSLTVGISRERTCDTDTYSHFQRFIKINIFWLRDSNSTILIKKKQISIRIAGNLDPKTNRK